VRILDAALSIYIARRMHNLSVKYLQNILRIIMDTYIHSNFSIYIT